MCIYITVLGFLCANVSFLQYWTMCIYIYMPCVFKKKVLHIPGKWSMSEALAATGVIPTLESGWVCGLAMPVFYRYLPK